MPSTAQLSLPLVMPAQAQKHVTVNQAFTILDTVTQLSVKGASNSVPPATPSEGEAFLVPEGASGLWAGRRGTVAVWSNGGWIHLVPRPGWRAWNEEQAAWQLFDGLGWISDATAVSPGGASLVARIVEFDHVIAAGTTNATAGLIPAGAQVVGVSGRVTQTIVGSGTTGWRIGVPGSDNRYGSGLGTMQNAIASGLTGSPVTYYAATPLLLTAEGGAFVSGKLRLAVHLLEVRPPRAV